MGTGCGPEAISRKYTMRTLNETELKQVSGAGTPHQGSGKNPSGNKVEPFSGNPHDRPGANAKVTP
jgi:hypothetical protein